MDAFKAQFERIKQQLSALTSTQKMLVAALVAVMVMTMLYWGKYAGNAEMVPVLDQALTPEEIGPIDRQLQLSGITHTVDTDKVLVPADQKLQIFADLMLAEALPQDTHSAFETMSKQLNPFSMSSERDATYNRATEMVLSQMIGHWKGVASARVVINPKTERHIEGSIMPSATVDIKSKGSIDDPKHLARAAADGIAGAVSGLLPSHISVIIDTVSYKLPDTDSLAGTMDQMEYKEKCEKYLEERIHAVFPIPDLTVNVNCAIDVSTTHEDSIKYGDKKDLVSAPVETTSHAEETNSSPSAPRDPGAGANTGGSNGTISVDSSSSTGGGEITSSTTSDETSKLSNYLSTTKTVKDSPAGQDTVLSATVRVPLSYITAAFNRAHPTVKDPSEAEIQKFTSQKLATITQGVKTIVGLKTDSDISVDTYEDFPTDLLMAPQASVPSATLSTVGGHAKEIALGVLAIVSLFLMASMVRKATPATIVMPQFAGSGGPVTVGSDGNSATGGESVTEVGGADATLDGMELNDEDVRTQQMLDQVSTMVKENPDSAAALVKRWLTRS
jgi:flagellar biosynthesis/type III secretory pathway M-ring protein FliF/YscJ